MDPYYSHSAVSNSDLSDLKKYLYGGIDHDPTEAYKFGTLIDCMITEPEKVDYYQLTCDGEKYKKEDFEKAEAMKSAFKRDEFSMNLLNQSSCQKIYVKDVKLQHGGFDFSLKMRCKFDLFMDALGWGGDIKSTASTTQKQFEEAVRYFDYDRQRAVYMTLSGSNRDVLIGISKVNYKIFKVPIDRNSELFKSGMEKFEDLAFKYWMLFDGFKTNG